MNPVRPPTSPSLPRAFTGDPSRAWSAAGTFARSALTGVGVAGGVGVAAAGLTLRNINEEVNRTIQLASTVDRLFKVSSDPGRNFAAAMSRSRELAGGIIRDAATLPGTSSDFFGATSMLASPVLGQGRDDAFLRRLVANVALVAPSAGQSTTDAASQAFRIMTGQAGMGDNPLFAKLVSDKLLPQIGMNAMSASKRLEMLDKALGSIAGSAEYRAAILGTFETQWGTFMDNIFGSRGILGRAMGGTSGYDSFVGGLRDTNTFLETYGPAISGYFMDISEALRSVYKTGPAAGSFGDWMRDRAAYFARSGEEIEATRMARGIVPDSERAYKPAWWREAIGVAPTRDTIFEPFSGRNQREIASAFEVAMGAPGVNRERFQTAVDTFAKGLPSMDDSIRRSLSPSYVLGEVDRIYKDLSPKAEDMALRAAPNITQNIQIRVDLKSDTSPEGIAVNLGKALDIVERRRGTSRRVMPVGPGTGSAR
jgi:hypothetical protein